MEKHIPLRMCVACRSMKPKSELIRLIGDDGKLVIDAYQKIQKRGAYVCNNADCISLLGKKRILGRVLKVQNPDEAYSELVKFCLMKSEE